MTARFTVLKQGKADGAPIVAGDVIELDLDPSKKGTQKEEDVKFTAIKSGTASGKPFKKGDVIELSKIDARKLTSRGYVKPGEAKAPAEDPVDEGAASKGAAVSASSTKSGA